LEINEETKFQKLKNEFKFLNEFLKKLKKYQEQKDEVGEVIFYY